MGVKTGWPLRLSTPQEEGVLQVSKWSKMQVLLDAAEMRELFSLLPPFLIYVTSEPVTDKSALVSPEEFLQAYEGYAVDLKEGKVPDEKPLRRIFSSILTTTPDILYAMKAGAERFLVKALKPIVQLQSHHFFVSTVDGRIHPMVLGKESIAWGIQFSYPQIYQSPREHDFFKVTATPDFPNTLLFTELAKWVRRNTLPTPLIVEGKRTNAPMRLGKKCFGWIGRHPQLAEKNISIGEWRGSHD